MGMICSLVLAFTVAFTAACQQKAFSGADQRSTPVSSSDVKRVIEAAIEQTGYTSGYDPSYVKIAYPGGDVPRHTGVCSDVLVRAFRKVGVDLQKEIHEDMKRAFSAYPKRWGLTRPDTNIDHRRVPNLMTYFKRKGKSLAMTTDPKDYLPGDVVAWDLGNGVLHVGLVTNVAEEGSENHLIVHNIGWGARLEDVLFSWRIIGHYRYF
ncbi:MAG: DUF1287 domain-containing protein [Blastocatellia bacterium]|nr:DUF1287 domain-containing protein [Blastocatellia bacterium]